MICCEDYHRQCTLFISFFTMSVYYALYIYIKGVGIHMENKFCFVFYMFRLSSKYIDFKFEK